MFVDLRFRDGELLPLFEIVDLLNRTSKRQYDNLFGSRYVDAAWRL